MSDLRDPSANVEGALGCIALAIIFLACAILIVG